MEEGGDLQGFTHVRAHLSLWEVYGDFLHHNNGTDLSGGDPDNTTWKIHWRRLYVQSTSWYSTPPGKVGSWFTAVLAAEWRGVIDWKWNSERTLIFAHAVLTKTRGTYKDRDILFRVNLRLDL